MVAKAGSLYLFMSHVVLLSGLKNTWVSGGEVVLLSESVTAQICGYLVLVKTL